MKRLIKVDTFDFSNYRLSASQPGIRVFIVVAAVYNVLLLIPDSLNLKEDALAAVCVMRLLFAVLCALFYFNIKRFRSFRTISAAVTASELLAVIFFLVVYSLYEKPDFMVQLLGMMLLMLLFFMVPNRLVYSLSVSLLAAVGFGLITFDDFNWTDSALYLAAAIYMGAEIAAGTAFGVMFLHYQRREYATHTELQKLYATDPLTQVGNRVRLESEADKWLAFCKRHGLPLSLVLLDIDNMKSINDQHGHLTGDLVIREFVNTICLHQRRNDVCVRWGGDEFVLLLPGTTASNARFLVDRIRGEVETHIFSAESRITCSFGIADLTSGNSLETLLDSADKLLYQAKRQGKNAACSHQN